VFLGALYDQGIHGYFDAVIHHPYTWSNPNAPIETVDNWTSMYEDQYEDTPNGPVFAKSLRTLMEEHGDARKPLWVTEYGAPSPITLGSGAVLDEAVHAKQITDALALWKTYPWAGTFIVFTYKDRDSVGARRDDHMGLIYSNVTTAPGCTSTGAPTGAAKKAYCALKRFPK
jgi:hypothetical protein